jgi:isoleucyl-tRNA synthetase
MIAMSTVLEDINPFETVLGFATQLGEDGRAMHKSWGNAIEFNEAADKIGADVMRWMFARQDPKENMLFGYKLADETRRQFHLKLWNIYNFFVTYANLDSWQPSIKQEESKDVLDLWLQSRLTETVSGVTEKLDSYDAYNASSLIDKFVDDFSVWYIRRSRGRRDNNFYNTTFNALITLSKILAPFNPFIADTIYKNLTKEESVHLSSWPEVNSKLQINNSNLLQEMSIVRQIVEIGHGIRKEKNVPVRQPLLELRIKNEELKIKELEQILLDELNVKSIKYNGKENQFDLNITPELKEEADTRDLVRKIQNARKEMGVTLDQKITVTNNWYPENKNLLEYLKTKTLAVELKSGEFSVNEV